MDVAPSSQRLICFLALQRKAIRRAQVSGTLWVDSTESRAAASLRSALWRMPKMCIGRVVECSTTHIWLSPNIDVDLRGVIARAFNVLDHGIAENEVLDVARELCALGDDLLAGWFDDWVILERERFRQLRLHALDRLGEQLLRSGRYCDALHVALTAAAGEPLRESAHRLVVRTHLGEGNIAEAVRHYRSYARLLFDELAVEPSDEMKQLLKGHCNDRPMVSLSVQRPPLATRRQPPATGKQLLSRSIAGGGL